MTQTELIIDPSTSQEPREIAETGGAMLSTREPSIQQILYHAIDRGVDVATLERLVALKERVDAEKAERELNAALRCFRDGCPQILKTRDVRGKQKDENVQAPVMYRYANLEDVKAVVDPRLAANDLSYSWDTDFVAGITTTTCTIRHVGGGKRSSRFSSGQAGAPAMNAAQAAGSTVSYGQRYSLLAVLGISADLDDDGRTANALPKPEADATQPKNGTREQGYAQPQEQKQPTPQKVLVKHVEALQSRWVKWMKLPAAASDDDRESSRAAFIAWIDKTLGVEVAEWMQGAWFEQAMWDRCDQGPAWMKTLLGAMK